MYHRDYILVAIWRARGVALLVAVMWLLSGVQRSVGSTSIVAWGINVAGYSTNVPPNLTNVVAIAVGYYHTLALKSDGTVIAWGDNMSGQTNVPTDLSNVVAVAAGALNSLALKNDGTVAAWGVDVYRPTVVPAGLSNWWQSRADGRTIWRSRTMAR